MQLTAAEALASIAVMSAVTFLTRALPFLLFDRGEHPPKIVLYLGKVLPPAIIAMLIVYCMKGVTFSTPAGWVPTLLAGAAAVLLHLWKGNDLISIFGATGLYMILVQGMEVFRSLSMAVRNFCCKGAAAAISTAPSSSGRAAILAMSLP